VGVANRDLVKPVQTSSAGEVFFEDDVCPCYEPPGNMACPQHNKDNEHRGHKQSYHLHYCHLDPHHHHRQQQQQQQQQQEPRGMCHHSVIDRSVHMTSSASYKGDHDHTQCIDSTAALGAFTSTCCVVGGVPCVGPKPPSTCVCSALFTPTGCGLLPHHAPTSWCTCTEQWYAAAVRGCTKRTSFYRRHTERQQQTSRSNSTYSRLSRRNSRTRAGNVGLGGYYLPHETTCCTSESSNDLCASTIPTATHQLVPMGSHVDRKEGDVIIDDCGGKYAAGYLHWQAIVLQPTSTTSFMFTSPPSCAQHAPQSTSESTATTDKDNVVEIVASAPTEHTELDVVGNIDEGIETKIGLAYHHTPEGAN